MLEREQVSERELLVLRAAERSGGGDEETFWQTLARFESWPGPNGMPLSVRSYLTRLAGRGLLDRHLTPSGSYRPPAAIYRLSEKGAALLNRHRAPEPCEPACVPPVAVYRLRVRTASRSATRVS